jgi:amino acid permease
MYGSKQTTLQAQRGVSLTGLIVGLAIIFGIAVLGMRVFPSVMEYKAAKEGIASAKRQGGTAAEMRNAFNKAADINMITSIDGKDLIVTKNNGDIELSFDYDKSISLFTDVSLVIHYAATTDKSGKIPEKPDAPVQ